MFFADGLKYQRKLSINITKDTFCFDRANNPVDKFATRQFDKWKLEIYNICGCIKFTMCFLYEVYVERCLKSFGLAKGIGKKRNGG